jgi:hypothetical protein
MENTTSGTEDSRKQYGQMSFDDFKKIYGEEYTEAINIETWKVDRNLAKLYTQIEAELFNAKRNELESHQVIRNEVFPKIQENPLVLHAGLHQDTTLELIEKMHKGFLFNGAVTACGSVSVMYDSLPISITQMGICLVNYQGQHGSYSHQLFRRDLKFNHSCTIQEAIELIERKLHDDKTKLNSLAMRSIKSYAERAILLEKSDAKWLMGYGFPAPYELMMGFWANQEDVKDKSIDLLQRLIVNHKRFVYIQACTQRPELWTLGSALHPFEYLIIETMEDKMVQMVNSGNTRLEIKRAYEEFARIAGAQIAVGVYKVSKHAPPQVFYCHVDHIHTAALIAMADSALQLHSGTPMLLDLAENLCKNAFGKNDFMTSIDQAYIRAEVLTKIKA